MSKNHINRNVKFLRVAAGMTQGEFGDLFNVTRDNIASYERGSEPRLEFVTNLVNYFEIPYKAVLETFLDEAGKGVADWVARVAARKAGEGETRHAVAGSGKSDFRYEDIPGQTRAAELEIPYTTEKKEPVKPTGWQNIPVHDLDATRGLAALFEEPQSFQPVDYIASSILPRCDGGLRISGDGMVPVVNSGDIVMYKQVNDLENAILWGEMYLVSFEVDREEYITVKYVHESDRPGYIRLVSHNPNHTPKEIALSQIKALGWIKFTVRVNVLR